MVKKQTRVNQYLPFASGTDSNVLTPEQYFMLKSRNTGFVAGIAKSQEINTPIRQSSVITSAIAQFICESTESDMLDNGDIISIVNRLKQAILMLYPLKK